MPRLSGAKALAAKIGRRDAAKRAVVAEGVAAFRKLPVDRSVVLYESFAGNGMLCNPEAIHRALRADPRFRHLRHVWALDDPARHPSVLAAAQRDPQLEVVQRRSAGYWRRLATAGFLINNATFPAEFAKRPEQTYLNTWHGTPLKRMGYDISGGAPAAGNIVRNFLQTDFLLSASPFMTEQLYAQAYRMRNIYRGRVIEAGYPRLDRQFADRREAVAHLAASGLELGSQRLLVLAPTWRGSSFASPRDDSEALAAQVARLAAALAPEWRVVVKVHQAVHAAAQRNPGLARFLVDNDVPANVVLTAADVLVTDYSSVLIDFLALDRPVILFRPDHAAYEAQRGLYHPVPGQPGPVLTDIDDVAAAVTALGRAEAGAPDDDPGGGPWGGYRDARREWREQLCPYEDGQAAQRVIDVVFDGARDGHRLVDLSSDGRPRVLMYLGELRPNGMTASALNLLRCLDHTKVDITALYPHSEDPERLPQIAALDPQVRSLPRLGATSGSIVSQLARQVVQRRGVGRRAKRLPLARHMRTEWQRCFGDAQFDWVVDFVGYAPFWDLLLLHGANSQVGGPARTAIWQHNDMVADSQRDVGGQQPLRAPLEAVFSTYRFFDRLVSVSAALRDVNAARLAQHAPAERFVHAQNLIEAQWVRQRASSAVEWRLPEVARPVGALSQPVTFVACGRLSSAKNFPRMISALAQIRDEFPDVRLVIVGDGPDANAVRAHIESLGLSHCVLLAGQQANPFPIMAASDCFLMSSDYEGQPMVILEALVLGLPVVTTRFASVASALPAGQGLVVDRSVAGMADGMRAFLNGEVPSPAFDVAAYNADAIRHFHAALDLESPSPGPTGPSGSGPAGRPAGDVDRH